MGRNIYVYFYSISLAVEKLSDKTYFRLIQIPFRQILLYIVDYYLRHCE
jgi:hypothetical protein